MDVLILAGGKTAPELQAQTGIAERARLPFGDRTMLDIVEDAVEGIGEPIVVAHFEPKRGRRVEPGNSFVGSLESGLAAVTTDHFLLVTADLPFLTTASINQFVERSDPDVLINYPIIPVELCDQAYPGMKRTALRLREGTFTGGNAALVNTALMRQVMPLLDRAYEARKHPLRLARMVGLGTLMRLLGARIFPGSLTIPALERDLARFLKGPVKAVISRFPELGADVDNAAQYEAALALMREKPGTRTH